MAFLQGSITDQVKEKRREADRQYLLRQVGRNRRLVSSTRPDPILGQSGAGMVSMHLGQVRR